MATTKPGHKTPPSTVKPTMSVPAPKPNEPLWTTPLKVFGCSGPIGCGKTTLMLTINPNPRTTIYYDFELSGTSHVFELNVAFGEDVFVNGVNYFNVAEEIAKVHPDGHKPADLWRWWEKHIVETCVPGKFKLAIVEPVSELEEALTFDVKARPLEYGLSQGQLSKAPGLIQWQVNSTWKRKLSNLAGRVETFAFASHQGVVFSGGKATQQKKSKGRSILKELATVFAWLSAAKDKDGNPIRDAPSASFIPPNGKDRLEKFIFKDGNLKPVPVMPPFMKRCTPEIIRWYMLNPVGMRGISEEEKYRPEVRTPEEQEAAQLEMLEAQTEAQRAKAEALQAEDRVLRGRERLRKEMAAQQPAAKVSSSTGQSDPYNGRTKAAYIARINSLMKHLYENKIMTKADLKASVVKRGGEKLSDLSFKALYDLNLALGNRAPGFAPWE